MGKSKTHFDAIVIGSGQAGNPLIEALADNGKKVAMIEKGHLGGTCVNTGCTPTKAYVASARAAWAVRNAEKLGVMPSGNVKVDLKRIKARKDILVNTPRRSIGEMLKGHKNITLIRGSAKFASPKAVEVNGQVYTADQIFINVGARPNIPKGFETVPYLTNESILQLDEIPERLIIVGGSYIGLEFAQIFRRFGSDVVIVEKDERLISKEDKGTSDVIADILKSEGVVIELNSSCVGGKIFGDGVEVQIDCKKKAKSIRGSHVLLATGRQSNADMLALNRAGIKHDGQYHITVDCTLETNIEGIYALGDCNGRGAFTQTAVDDYEIIKANLLEKGHRTLNDRHLNYALYIDPPMGRVGLSRDQALAKGRTILYGYVEMKDISRAKEKAETQGFMEVVIDRDSEKIIGATVIGTGGDEIIGVFITAMYSGLSYQLLRDSVQTHPTVTELIPSMLKGLEEITSSL